MSLNEHPELRNEIAHRYMRKRFSERPLPTLHAATSELQRLLPDISPEEAGEYANDMINEVFALKVPLHRFNRFLDQRRSYEISWHLLLSLKYDEGIKIGQMNRRQIGNEAKQLNVTPRVAWEFARLVAKEVFERTFNSES